MTPGETIAASSADIKGATAFEVSGICGFWLNDHCICKLKVEVFLLKQDPLILILLEKSFASLVSS